MLNMPRPIKHYSTMNASEGKKKNVKLLKQRDKKKSGPTGKKKKQPHHVIKESKKMSPHKHTRFSM